jgi:hypothetical protein
MTEEKEQKQGDHNKKEKEQDWPKPFCTKAPSAEQSRASDEDEPCDDARGTVTEGKKD